MAEELPSREVFTEADACPDGTMRAGGGGGDSDPTTIFVKGFSRDLEESDVRQQLTDAFAECGEVAGVRLPTDRETGALKGIAFIEFASPDGKVSTPSLWEVHVAGVAVQQSGRRGCFPLSWPANMALSLPSKAGGARSGTCRPALPGSCRAVVQV